VRTALNEAGFGSIKLVGPDEVTIEKTMKTLKAYTGASKDVAALFDVVGSHTQTDDVYGTVEGWTKLREEAHGKPVWNTEGSTATYETGNPCSTDTNSKGKLKYKWCPSKDMNRPGLKPAVDAGVEAWVIWGAIGPKGMVNPRKVNKRKGGFTKEGCLIAIGVVKDYPLSLEDCNKLP